MARVGLGAKIKRRLNFEFEPSPAALYFERGQKSEVRLFFFKDNIPHGLHSYTLRISVSNDVTVAPTSAEEYGLEGAESWPIDSLDWESSPVDLSFLNKAEKPAGLHGFVRADHGHFTFADGTPARFWGTNIAAYALFGTSRENTKLQAHRLAQLGFNLVRIHHHDSTWVVPNIFGDKGAIDTQHISQSEFEKLDWWIKCLEDEGIYVWLDLEDGRQFKLADHIEDFDEISKGKSTADLRGYNYINKSIADAMRNFNQQYLMHQNIYTGRSYANDPGIIALLITNENDLTTHFGNSLLPDKHVPKANADYMARAAAFATKYGLPKDTTWRSWEHGPSKLFLNDLEHDFDAETINGLRSMGVKVPIATTSSWGNDPLSALPALTTGNVVDVHSYGAIDEVRKNPLYAASFVDWIAAAHVVDRPLSVTEWNVSPFPTPDRNSAAVLMAAMGDFQGWDAPMLFAYSQQPLNGSGGPSNWDTFNDPELISILPAAALLFRRGDVQPANTTYVFTPSATQLFGQLISPRTSVALRTAVEKGKLLIAMPPVTELPWLQTSDVPEGAVAFSDPNRSFLQQDATAAVSDTGELRHDWTSGTFNVDTPRSQIAAGWIGGKRIALTDITIDMLTPNGTVAVQSIDDHPIRESNKILISLSAISLPSRQNKLPFHCAPVSGNASC